MRCIFFALRLVWKQSGPCVRRNCPDLLPQKNIIRRPWWVETKNCSSFLNEIGATGETEPKPSRPALILHRNKSAGFLGARGMKVSSLSDRHAPSKHPTKVTISSLIIRFINCIEKVGLIWHIAFYIRYNIFNIQHTKKTKQSWRYRNCLKMPNRLESPACSLQQTSIEKKMKEFQTQPPPEVSLDNWNSFKKFFRKCRQALLTVALQTKEKFPMGVFAEVSLHQCAEAPPSSLVPAALQQLLLLSTGL